MEGGEDILIKTNGALAVQRYLEMFLSNTQPYSPCDTILGLQVQFAILFQLQNKRLMDQSVLGQGGFSSWQSKESVSHSAELN